MNRYRLSALVPERYEVWAWWDEPRRGFFAQVHYLDPDGQDTVLQVGTQKPIATVQALCEALQDYARPSIEQKVQLLQDKAATPVPLIEQVRGRVRLVTRGVGLLWQLRPRLRNPKP